MYSIKIFDYDNEFNIICDVGKKTNFDVKTIKNLNINYKNPIIRYHLKIS